MYRYDYERLEMGGGGWSPIGGFGLTAEKYREIVDRRAAAGWRVVTAVPLEGRTNGMLETIDLVFEKEIK